MKRAGRSWLWSLVVVLGVVLAGCAGREPGGDKDAGTVDSGTPGDPDSGTPAGVAVRHVAAGHDFSLALKVDGTLWARGNNTSGQLGDGTTLHRQEPVQVSPAPTGVVALAAGSQHSLALKEDGTVRAWGDNTDGQLGDGTSTPRLTPTQVPGLTGVVALAAGKEHSLTLKSDGTLWAWGDNGNGQLGDGTTTPRLTPTQVPGLTGVASLVVGFQASLAVMTDGTVRAWGSNLYGQFGNGASGRRPTPARVF